MIIRRALAQDENELAEFNSSIARETEGVELIPEVIGAGVKAMIENPHMGFYLVVELDNGIQASLMVTTEWSDWRNGTIWWMQSVYVHPSYRKQGVFHEIFKHIETIAANTPSIQSLRLYVMKNNETGLKTYQSIGMSSSGYLVYEKQLLAFL